MLIIGLNGVDGAFHDSSASAFVDGKLVFSIEEERLNRRKHSSGLPVRAVEECLRFVGATIDEVDAFGYYLDPEALYRCYFLRTVREYWPRSFPLYRGRKSIESYRNIGQQLRKKLGIPPSTPVYFFNHHLCHAASAAHFSGFDEAAILVIDGSGDDESASLFVLEGALLRKAATFANYPKSLGFFYASIADFIGLGWLEGPGKMMGLAPYGEPKYYEALRRVIFDGDSFDVDMDYFEYHLNRLQRLSPKMRGMFPVEQRKPTEPLESEHADIAASAQLVLEDAVLFMASAAKKLSGKDRLGYAGGVALNIDANSRVSASGLFSEIAIHPAAYDGGTSIGAGYLAQIQRFGIAPEPLGEVFLGSSISVDGVNTVAERHGLCVRRHSDNDRVTSAAKRLAQRQVIGWAEGRMEIGPRALTHRSIYAHPGMDRDAVNRIKQREAFRPFAPIITEAKLEKVFCGGPQQSPHMLFRYNTRPAYHDSLKGVVHVDGSSRVQTVSVDDRETTSARQLLAEFERITGLPVILNTSFNLRGQPLVATLEHVVEVLLKTDLSAAYVEDYEIYKPSTARA